MASDRLRSIVPMFGGATQYVESLNSILEYVETNQPTTDELVGWHRGTFENVSSRDSIIRRIRYLEDVGFVQEEAGRWSLGPEGERYASGYEASTLRRIMCDRNLGLRSLLHELSVRPMTIEEVSDQQLDTHPDLGWSRGETDMAHQRANWLRSMGLVRKHGDQYELTVAGRSFVREAIDESETQTSQDSHEEADEESSQNDHPDDTTGYQTHSTIDVDGKVSGPVAVKIDSIDDRNHDGIIKKLRGTDLEGGTFEIKIWNYHDIETEWEKERWYGIYNVRSRIWAAEPRDSVGMLMSTTDTKIRDLGLSPPEPIEPVKDRNSPDRNQPESDGETPTNPTAVSEESRAATDNESRSTERETRDELTEYQKALVEEVERLSNELGRIPAAGDMKEYGQYSIQEYYSEFEKWKHAVEASNIDYRSELIDDLRATADKLNKRPTTTEIDKHGKYNYNRYTTYFEDWDAAIEAAGIESPTEEELLDELQRIDQTHDRIPFSNLVQAEGKFAPVRYQEHFGSIDNALNKAGIDKKERLKDELKRLSQEVEGPLTTTKVNELGKYSSSMITNVFGSWDSAKEAANISTPGSPQKKEILTRSDISSDGRLGGPFAIRTADIDDNPGKRIATKCEVEDLSGQNLQLVIWETHDSNTNWREGDWYVLEEARGKCWETDSGRTQYQLNSTRELEVRHTGPSRRDSWVPLDTDSKETESEDKTAKSENDDRKHGNQDSDGRNSVTKAEELVDDILDELGL